MLSWLTYCRDMNILPWPRSRSEFSYGQNNSGFFLLEDIFVMGKRKARVQLNPEEKKSMIEQIKLNASDENLRRLTDNWNAKHGPSRQIDRTHLIRLKSTIPQFSTSAEFWATVALQVTVTNRDHRDLSQYVTSFFVFKIQNKTPRCRHSPKLRLNQVSIRA